MIDVTGLKFDEKGLIPAIVQDAKTKDVLMLAYMNKASIEATRESGYATFYSRSRAELWKKGATSGHLQPVKSMAYDCDQDALLVTVDQVGVACHTGSWSCFGETSASGSVVEEIYATLEKRRNEPKEGSYTTYLFEQGVDKILKKVGEESAEVIIAAKNKDNDELKNELSDLLYHSLVLMVERGLTLEEVRETLKERQEK